MMNCDQYREAIAADPSFDGGAGHLSECSACQTYRKEMLALNQRISRALALNVPELKMPELPEIIAADSAGSSTSMADNVAALPKRTRAPLNWTSPTWIAMAATVVLAAFVGFRMIGSGVEYATLGDELLAHIDHERASLVVTDIAVSDARLTSVVPADVARLDHSAGLITYAQDCVIRGHHVPHLVMQGEHGPVTILLMPEIRVSAPQTITGENVNGVILPVGDGSIAIIAEREESLGRIERKVLDSVTWST
jgi:hypothetical protein